MRILLEGDCLADYLAKVHEAYRSGLRRMFDTRVFGEGYPGFDPAISSYRELISKISPDLPPELLIVFYEIERSYEKRFRFDDLAQINIPKAFFVGDSWRITDVYKDEFIEIVQKNGIDCIFSYFPMLLDEYRGTAIESKITFLPPCIDPEIFNDWKEKKRFDIGFLAAGTTSPEEFYPERWAIHQKLKSRTDLRYLYADHPGWNRGNDAHPLVGKNFSKAINQCQIFVTTAGKKRHPNPKYFEILASKSLLFAERPLCAEMLELRDGWNYVEVSPENILDKLDYFLAHPELCEAISERGYETAMTLHSCEARALDICRAFLGTVRGDYQSDPRSFTTIASSIQKTQSPLMQEAITQQNSYTSESRGNMSANNLIQVPEELINDDDHLEILSLPGNLKELLHSAAPQYSLYRLIRYLKPKKILEIGTQMGSSAIAMAIAQRDNGDPVDVTCIDPFLVTGDNEGFDTLQLFYNQVGATGYLSTGIKLHMGFSGDYLKSCNETFDFIAIDGSHRYEDVKSDFRLSLPRCALGGYLWFHDYVIYESVRNACNEVVVEKQLPFAVNLIQTNPRGDNCGWALARNLPYQHLREMPGVEVRLNLGSGGDYREEYINIDLDPDSKVDIRMNYLNIDQVFAPESVTEVSMIHSIGYLNLWQARELFQKVRRVLKPGGKFILETPNQARAVEKIQSAGRNLFEHLEGVRAFHAFGVDQIERRESYHPYAFSWSEWHLSRELEEAGFGDVRVLPPQTHSAWRDMRLEGTAPQKKNSNHREQSAPSKGSLLVLYDSELGHVTMQQRGLTLRETIQKNGWQVQFLDIRKTPQQEIFSAADRADAAYLLKVSSLPLLRALKTRTKVIFDFADALWQPQHREAGWRDLETLLSEADLVTVENDFLTTFAGRFNRTVTVPVVTHVEKFAAARRRFSKNGAKVRIGWAGTEGTAPAIHAIAPQLRAILHRFPETELRLVGCSERAVNGLFDPARVSVRERYDEDSMVEEIVGFDIGIFPPPFNEEEYIGRGAQKAVLYMQGGVPPVALNLGDCAREIIDGVTGMLVRTPEEWETKIASLVQSAELRRRMGEQAIVSASREHSHQAVFEKLEQAVALVRG